MADFQDIIGHQNIIRHFQSAIAQGKVGHAYILNGPDRAGKRLLADAFAQTLQCESPEAKKTGSPCHACRSCKQAESGNNPDIINVLHEKPNTISVEDIRTQVVNTVDIKPYAYAYKVYIIDEAEKMNVQAQNALLKTIEEPPHYAVILLLTNNADLFLQTILSRCVRLDLTAVADEVVRAFLMKQVRIPDYEADLCVAFAQGNVGKAITLATSEDFHDIRESVIDLMKRIREMDLAELVAAVRRISDEKLVIQDYFDIMMIWFRDVLLYKATKEIDALTFKDEILEIKKQADRSTYQGLEAVIEAIGKAKARLQANVNFELTLEMLLLTIKEA